MTADARLVVVVPPELESGFLLAGVEVSVVIDAAQAGQLVDRLVHDVEEGVLAIYEPFLAEFAVDRRAQLERSLTPVVVPLPSGVAAAGEPGHRARLLGRLQRAIGFHVTFGDDAHD